MQMQKLFVYGTLMIAESDPYNHGHGLMQGGTVLGTDTIGGTMYNCGAFPGVVPSDDPTREVHGQVVSFESLSDEAWRDRLKALDRYEGVAGGLYRRAPVSTAYGDAWVYYFDLETLGLDIIESGNWRERS